MSSPLTIHRRNNFDILRLLFAILVILSHSCSIADGNNLRDPVKWLFGTLDCGTLAVDFFFILSGYLIASSWDNDPSPASFLSKRILRIYPGFLIASVFSVFIVGTIGAADSRSYLHQVNMFEIASKLLTLRTPTTPPTFENSHYAAVNGSIWTIHYEFACYLIILFMGWLGLLRNRWLIAMVFLCVLVGFYIYNHRFPNADESADTRNVLSWLQFAAMFLSGVLAHKFNVRSMLNGKIAVLAAMASIVLMFSHDLANVGIMVFGAYVIFYIGFMRWDHKWLGFLPDISYGVYLYGWPVQKLVVHAGIASGPASLFVVTLPLAILLALASWYAIEAPALRLKPRRASGVLDRNPSTGVA